MAVATEPDNTTKHDATDSDNSRDSRNRFEKLAVWLHARGQSIEDASLAFEFIRPFK